MNKEEPLVRALLEKGPVAISVAASDWHSYSKGIFNSCSKDCVVDHAVTLFGFGQENAGSSLLQIGSSHRSASKFWLIRNSWGTNWGENGYIRMFRHDNEEAHCGIDNDPQKGVACDGSPSQVRVCGSCGILYDNVVPNFGKSSSNNPKAPTASYLDVQELSVSPDELAADENAAPEAVAAARYRAAMTDTASAPSSRVGRRHAAAASSLIEEAAKRPGASLFRREQLD
jgi:hypothetical protein